MKKLLLLCLLVTLSSFAYAETKEADKRWLEAVQKLVTEGKKQVSTPNPERVELVKDWARKQGYSVDVVRVGTGYRLELNKLIAKKG